MLFLAFVENSAASLMCTFFQMLARYVQKEFIYKKNPYQLQTLLLQAKQIQTQEFRYHLLLGAEFNTSSISCITKMLQMSCKTSATPPSVPPEYKKKPFAHFPYKEIQRREGGKHGGFLFPSFSNALHCI